LTFWPGFNPVTVAVALFLFVDVLAFGIIFAVAGTFAAAWGQRTPESPAPPLLPPPTTNTRTDVTLFGTCQLQLPTVVKVRTVSPLTVVEVGAQLFALAGSGIETNNPEIKVAITVEIIFDRAALIFMRTKPSFTFTSLFSLKRERLKRKSGVIGHL
jgi:hypothetical protein